MHHPFLFAQNALQPNVTNFNAIENASYIPPARTQLHDEQYTLAMQQQQHQQQQHQHQILAANQTMFSTDMAPHCLKKDSCEDSSVAVVAPVFLDFGQKNKVQGIPLLCSVSQLLNLPAFEQDRMTSTSMKSMYSPIEGQQRHYNSTEASLESSLRPLKHRKDPISQLGEAANMILQSEEMKGLESHFAPTPISVQSYDTPPSATTYSIRNAIEARNYDAMPSVKMPTSKNLKNRTCPYCQKIFARPFTLKSHIRRHTKEKPYTCNVCQRSFSQSATLENHKLTHTGVKPHQCHLCLKRFAHQTSLKTHLRIHSGEQPYKCEFCARRFTDGSTLQKHKRTHSGDKPFRCQFCLKCFSQSGNMKRHMATTHKDSIQGKDVRKSYEPKKDSSLLMQSTEGIGI